MTEGEVEGLSREGRELVARLDVVRERMVHHGGMREGEALEALSWVIDAYGEWLLGSRKRGLPNSGEIVEAEDFQ